MRKLAKLIRNVVAFVETVSYGKLLPYWQSERDKIKSLKQKGDFEAKITPTHLSKKGLIQLENKTKTATKSRKLEPVDATIYTDVSLEGKWAVFGKSETGDMWTNQEKELHINYPEVLGAIPRTLRFFKEIQALTTLGTWWVKPQQYPVLIIQSQFGRITFDVWQWVAEQQIWISAPHAPGSENLANSRQKFHNV